MSKKNKRLMMRSGTQCCEICNLQTPLQCHHLRGRNIKDWNKEGNLAWLCPSCHDRTHLGLIIIEGWFQTTAGRELLWHNKGEATLTDRDITPPSYH